MTLDRLLRHLDRSPDSGALIATVVVVDEASMVGTRKLARLLDHAHSRQRQGRARRRPLSAPRIDAGGAFVGLAARLHAPQLDRRTAARLEPWNALALAQLRDRRRQSRLRLLPHSRAGSITDETASDCGPTRRRLVDRPHHRTLQLMLANRNADVDDLNQRARQPSPPRRHARSLDHARDRRPQVRDRRRHPHHPQRLPPRCPQRHPRAPSRTSTPQPRTTIQRDRTRWSC